MSTIGRLGTVRVCPPLQNKGYFPPNRDKRVITCWELAVQRITSFASTLAMLPGLLLLNAAPARNTHEALASHRSDPDGCTGTAASAELKRHAGRWSAQGAVTIGEHWLAAPVEDSWESRNFAGRDSLRRTLTRATPAQVGMSAPGLAHVDSIIEAAIAQGAAPGAAIAIGRHGRLVRLRGYGRLDYRPNFGAVTDSTLYDLASLTKVVATTTAAMLLVDDGALDLDAPVGRYLPEWRGSAVKERVTVRNLLLHNSGLTAGSPLWRTAHNSDDALRIISTLSLEYEPGSRAVYSDFGMILVALIVERLSGKPLDLLLAERVFRPLGLRETMFNPLGQTLAGAMAGKGLACCIADAHSTWFPRIAPTEVDRTYRKQHMHGRVHDENAFAIGGIAGHAGLFSSARDLAVFSQMMLNGGYYDGQRIITPQTIRRFTTRADSRFSRALGWDTPDPPQNLNSSAGLYFSPSSFGHTGFTGTSIWIDPEHDLFVVLLTNRVNPTRDNNRHIALRIAVSDAVQQAIADQPVKRRR